MQRLRRIYWFIGLVVFALQACNPKMPSDGGAVQSSPPDRHCGFSQLFEVRTEAGRAIGAFELKNDEKDLWIIYFPTGGFRAEKIDVFWGEAAQVPKDDDGNPDITKFPIKDAKLNEGGGWFSKLTANTNGPCGTMVAYVTVSKEDEQYSGWVTSGNLGNQKKGVEYCRQSCANLALGCSIDDTIQPPLTVTQEQWVSTDETARGQAKTLEKFFARVFPEGLTLGCERKCRFSSAQAVLQYLPQKGDAQSLIDDLEDPTALNGNNVLLAELLALKLTLAFDKSFPTFSPAPMQLAGLEVADGAFRGWNVAELATEAETILGGCASNYSPQQINQVIIDVNAAFSLKDKRSKFLICPVDQ